MSFDIETKVKTLKKSKHRIVLKDGEELQYHVPRRPEGSFNLRDYVPHAGCGIEVEIGSGTGRFLSLRSQIYKDRFFIGIDKRKDRIDSTKKKLSRIEDKNWILLREDARCFLAQGIPPLKVLHVYHPDPWPKERHHKHRFFRSPDAKEWAMAIVKGGELRLSTDHKGYFDEIMKIVDSWELFRLKKSYIKNSGKPWSRFEEIFISRGEPVYKAVFVRI